MSFWAETISQVIDGKLTIILIINSSFFKQNLSRFSFNNRERILLFSVYLILKLIFWFWLFSVFEDITNGFWDIVMGIFLLFSDIVQKKRLLSETFLAD